MQWGSCESIPVGVLGYPICIGSVFFPLVDQSETMGHQGIPWPGRGVYFQFDLFLTCLCYHPHYLSIFQALFCRVIRVHTKPMVCFAFVPDWIAHLRISIAIHVQA